jgi:deoxyribose-phosphate aldolase
MSDLISDALLARIETRRQELSHKLHLDPENLPAYVMSEPSGPFPELTPEQQGELWRGFGKDILVKTIDHTILKAEATPEQISTLCAEAIEHGFVAVCVNGAYVGRAASLLVDSPVQVAAVVGFPLGMMSSEAKAYEARLAVEEGASEIDMVINVGWLKAGMYLDVLADIEDVVQAAAVPVKVIIETALLTEDEKIDACLLARFGQAAFVKTSTGFSTGGATVDDVALMRAVVGEGCGVKASGGIKTRQDALAMIKAGANRIGTSSGLAIIRA